MLITESALSRIKLMINKNSNKDMEFWKVQKECAIMNKIKEQKENFYMLEKYWPWGCTENAKQRKITNLRLEEIFPIEDYNNVKRFMGTVALKREGVGANMTSKRENMNKIHEDPMLRFQFGNKNLRRYVDNILRYKTDSKTQHEYKKQLGNKQFYAKDTKHKSSFQFDQLVEEKKLKDIKEKSQTKLFQQKQSWSKENVEKENVENDLRASKNFNMIKDTSKAVQFDHKNYAPKNITFGKNRTLSPLTEASGVELVKLLAKNKKFPLRIPLCSSDITSEAKIGKSTIWNREGSTYLKGLSQQIKNKKELLKDTKAKENEFDEHHFNTWNGFWGRPGHGAPLPELKKKSLQNLLFPQKFPIRDKLKS